MRTKTGNARRAIPTLTARAAPRQALLTGIPRRPNRTEMTIATRVATIWSNPPLENGLGMGLRLLSPLKVKARTSTIRYARRTHHPGSSSGSRARNSQYAQVPNAALTSAHDLSRIGQRRFTFGVLLPEL